MPLEPKPDKDKEADERDREEKAIRTRNRKGGAGYDPTDVSELFAPPMSLNSLRTESLKQFV